MYYDLEGTLCYRRKTETVLIYVLSIEHILVKCHRISRLLIFDLIFSPTIYEMQMFIFQCMFHFNSVKAVKVILQILITHNYKNVSKK